jgi:hypothetical protein
MSDQHDLTDYGIETTENKAPLVRRKVIVWSPTAEGKPAGFVGRDRARGYKIYTSRRKPYHFYRAGDGYALSDAIIRRLSRGDIERILFHTYDDSSDTAGDVYEFTVRQFVDGESVPREDLLDQTDPQTYVPLPDARNAWEYLANDLFVQEFGEAMDRITEKRGWD